SIDVRGERMERAATGARGWGPAHKVRLTRRRRAGKLAFSMRRCRRRLSWVASGWLALQLAAFAAAPIGLCCAHTEDATTSAAKPCCPGIAPGQVCPMHHTREGARTCTMRTACLAGDAALLQLFTIPGFVPATSSIV